MGSIRIGTASWTDPTLIASGWYPDEAKSPEARLKHYAGRFPLVEVDSTYYALPSLRNAELWVARTPERFIFDIKAFRLFTGHPTSHSALPADIRKSLGPVAKDKLYGTDMPSELRTELVRRFIDALEPLQAAGKLGAVLLQFPPWMVYRPSNLEGVLRCAEALRPLPVAVEFRHRSWFDEKHRAPVLAALQKHRLAHVVVDEPQGFAASIPQVWERTSPALAIFRLHGRNHETWQAKGLSSAAERFNYSYSQAELEEFKASVNGLAERAEHVHVLFNNCYGDKGVRNALEFREIVGGADGA